jgi:molybdopterin-biosynthesis enzyme MoeA-like protein
MTNPTAAMLVIGDEILSGRTREANAHHLAGRLGKLGIDLREIRVVPDDHAVIVDALNALRAKHTHVFTSGGIGPTHDDITADAVAAAFGVGIDVRDDARALLQAAVGHQRTLTAEHLRMARIPHGAELITNRISGAPGFSVENVHVMAGVPSIFVAMLDVLLPGLESGRPVLSGEVRFEVGEGRIAAPLRDLAAAMPELSIGSYPFQDGATYGTNIVVRGTDQRSIDRALERLADLRRSLP